MEAELYSKCNIRIRWFVMGRNAQCINKRPSNAHLYLPGTCKRFPFAAADLRFESKKFTKKRKAICSGFHYTRGAIAN